MIYTVSRRIGCGQQVNGTHCRLTMTPLAVTPAALRSMLFLAIKATGSAKGSIPFSPILILLRLFYFIVASAEAQARTRLRKVNRSQFLGRPDSFPNIQSPTGDAGLHWFQSRCSIPKTSTFLYFSLPYYTFLRQAHDSRAMRKTGRLARQSDLPRRNSRSRLLLPLLK